jgi:ATP-dependent Clp protease ATP-binding subunit ClpA
MMHGYNFTERVRKVLAMAREEANGLQHEYVGTEHILLALIREGAGVADTVLTNLGVDQEQLRDQMLSIIKAGRADEHRMDLPYTSRAKKVLELAMAEARELNHSYVGTEHLLLGLIAEHKGIAAQVLVDAGVTLEAAREETVRVLGTEMQQAPGRAQRPLTRRARSAEVALTERARRVMARAYDLASDRGATVVRGAHVAIAVLEHGEGLANAVLDHLQADREALRAARDQLAPPSQADVTPETVLSLDPALIDSPDTSDAEFRRGIGIVAGTGQLLLGVLTAAPEVGRVFEAQGVTAGRFREELRRISG